MDREINMPLVSIVTVVYNGATTLEQTIKSVLNQTYKNIEYIVIDGGSKDGSTEIIKKYSEKIEFWVSEKDAGIYDAMNKGLIRSKGTLIAILNSDDWYEIDAVEKMVHAHILNPDADIVHGLLRFISEDGLPDLISGHYHSFLNRGMIEHPTCFIKRTLYDRVGYYNTIYRSAADYEWMLRAKNADAAFFLNPQVITNFRRGGMSDSHLGFSEELLIKKRYGVISGFKYSYWKLYTKVLKFIK